MKSLFTDSTQQEILDRLSSLNENSQSKWGTMDVSQMLAHCQFPLRVALQELALERPNAVKRFCFLFKSSLYNDKPWKQGLPTAPPLLLRMLKCSRKKKSNW